MARTGSRRIATSALVLALCAGTASCGQTVDGASKGKATPTTQTQTSQTTGSQAKGSPQSQSGCATSVPFSPASFPQAPRVDNPWLPLTPNTRIVLQGDANRGSGDQPHQVIFTVTDLVKVINGVANVVVWDQDIQDGDLAEAELAFFAQDLTGNVWNLGEYPEEYESGKFSGAPSTWFSGQGPAVGGIHMAASPTTGKGWYLQGSVPSIKFLDCARIVSTDAKACVPVKCFSPVLITEETSPLDPTSGIQRKSHAQGIGIIKVDPIGGAEGETLKLVKSGKLTPAESRTAHASALALETHAYKYNRVYQQTQHAR